MLMSGMGIIVISLSLDDARASDVLLKVQQGAREWYVYLVNLQSDTLFNHIDLLVYIFC